MPYSIRVSSVSTAHILDVLTTLFFAASSFGGPALVTRLTRDQGYYVMNGASLSCMRSRITQTGVQFYTVVTGAADTNLTGRFSLTKVSCPLVVRFGTVIIPEYMAFPFTSRVLTRRRPSTNGIATLSECIPCSRSAARNITITRKAVPT